MKSIISVVSHPPQSSGRQPGRLELGVAQRSLFGKTPSKGHLHIGTYQEDHARDDLAIRERQCLPGIRRIEGLPIQDSYRIPGSSHGNTVTSNSANQSVLVMPTPAPASRAGRRGGIRHHQKDCTYRSKVDVSSHHGETYCQEKGLMNRGLENLSPAYPNRPTVTELST